MLAYLFSELSDEFPFASGWDCCVEDDKERQKEDRAKTDSRLLPNGKYSFLSTIAELDDILSTNMKLRSAFLQLFSNAALPAAISDMLLRCPKENIGMLAIT